MDDVSQQPVDATSATPDKVIPVAGSKKDGTSSSNTPSSSATSNSLLWISVASLFLIAATCAIAAATLAGVTQQKTYPSSCTVPSTSTVPAPAHGSSPPSSPSAANKISYVEVALSSEAGKILHNGPNICVDKKPAHADAAAQDYYFNNTACLKDNVIQVLEQAGANVTVGFVGGLDAGGRVPISEPLWKMGMCPVNVHWHLGAEHLSMGEYDEFGSAPSASQNRKLLAVSGLARQGSLCHHYKNSDPKFTTEYNWKHCVNMEVGNTYEVHWPHSAAGACGTVNQFQTPFYDGVFCRDGIISLSPLNTFEKIGVHAQVFTVVNDESYYYPDMIRGMIVDGEMGKYISKYTGSTTSDARSNTLCSKYTPITWQVDRKCHMISASSFDKMCADMKAQRDDMTEDLYPHGAREHVAQHLSANNMIP